MQVGSADADAFDADDGFGRSEVGHRFDAVGKLTGGCTT
jgi:hypothetical protein